MVILEVLIFLVSIFFVVKGANLFVSSGSRIARKLGVSEFVIGLTLIALGTSLPELFSSVIASFKGQSDLVIGTILGANVANLTLVIGTAALLSGKIKLEKEVLKRDIYMLAFVIILFSIFILDGSLSRIEGVIFLLFFVGYNSFLIDSKMRFQKQYGFKKFFKHLVQFNLFGIRSSRKKIRKRKPSWKDFLILIIGGVFLFVGAEYLIKEAVFIAEYFAVSIIVIGILISIGTTMPEMFVALSSSRRGYGEIAVGNSIGSAITNTLLILGLSAIIFPLNIIRHTVLFMVPFLIFSTLILAIFIKTKWRIPRVEGILLILVYILFLLLSFKII